MLVSTALFLLLVLNLSADDNRTSTAKGVFSVNIAVPLSIKEEIGDVNLGDAVPGSTTEFKSGEKGVYFMIQGQPEKSINVNSRIVSSSPDVSLENVTCEYFDGISWSIIKTTSPGVYDNNLSAFDFKLNNTGALSIRIFPGKM